MFEENTDIVMDNNILKNVSIVQISKTTIDKCIFGIKKFL